MRTALPGPLLLACLLALGGCTCGGVPVEPGGPDSGAVGQDGGPGGDAGTDGGTGGSACLQGGEVLEVSPAQQSATLTTGTPQSFSFTAQARTGSSTRDVTAEVTWSASREDDSPPGTISAQGVYQPEAGVGGAVTVRAEDGCGHAATARLTLRLEATFNPPAPQEVARFEGEVVVGDAQRSPSVIYPSSGTRFPRNIYKVLFQWERAGHSLFRLTFEGPHSRTVVYTDGNDAGCTAVQATAGCWEADVQTWQAIAGSNAGEVTSLTVDGVSEGDASVYRAAPIELGFSRRDVKGAIFYWSTTAAGIRRASVSDSAPEPYVVGKPVPTVLEGGASVKCVACHTVSRSGRKLFAGTQTSTVSGEFVYDVTVEAPPRPLLTDHISRENKGFGTFSPDDTRVVATVGDRLLEFSVEGGEQLATLPMPRGTNPDWSPDGDALVFSDQRGDSPGGANLQVIARSAEGTWGEVRTLAPAAGLTNLFPSYSPDGEWVAYARGKGGHGDVTLQLFLVKEDGTRQPVELLAANRVVNGTVTDGRFENNMPTWAPSGDLWWVAFNSLRPYGALFPEGGRQQIWVAAIDPARLESGEDPSFPAFRFAFQNLNEDNHRAFWTLDVRDPEEPGPTCRPAGSDCSAGGADACCEGLECLATSELTSACSAPPEEGDGGVPACLAPGSACDQTAGPSCCAGSVCDVGAGGSTVCQVLID